MSAAILRSGFTTALTRYGRSRGLWLILLVAPIGARFAIARDGGGGLQVAVDDHLPVLDWPTIGVCLGVIVATVLLPVAWGYLRANVTRRHAWQVEEVTAAARPALALGRFGADLAVFAGALVALTLAGWVLAWTLGVGKARPGALAFGLWVTAAPALAMVAAVRRLWAARPLLRGALGDVAFFFLWIWALLSALIVSGGMRSEGFVGALADPLGFLRPIMWTVEGPGHGLTIGTTELASGRVPLDVMSGLLSPGYLPSRFAWLGIAVAVAALAGALHRPHTARPSRAPGRLTRWLAPGPPPAADAGAGPAKPGRLKLAGLVLSEARLIASGRLFAVLAVGAALMGMVGDYRHIGSPAALLLLTFALTAHAGRTEAVGLRSLTGTTRFGPWARRAAFVAAGTGWALLLAVPAALVTTSAEPLRLALLTGGAASLTAIALAALTGTAFVPRLVLLIAWYGYLSS